MYNLSYTFDKIGNVDSIHNSAGIINEMGGSYYHKYTYDNFNRISTAHGSWNGDPMNTLGNKASNYTLEMAYENMHRITTKQQEHIRDASIVGENTYDNLFKYEDVNHPNAVTSIENQSNSEVEEFNYDANGNVLLHEFDNGDTKNMLWDEANMLKAIKISNAGSFQHYIYDANGERTLKGIGQYGLMDLNGLSQTVSTIGNYSQYVSGYMVMGPHYMVTNHYYSGTERIACKLVGSVDSSVDNSLELSGSEKAGLPDRQAEDLELVRTEFGFDTLIIDDVDPDEDDCEGNNDCPNVLYFFHPDHIGSSTFLTDEAGNPYQFILYLPFGESMAEQKAGGYSTKYRFTGKEVDEETGLYYFGARYYDPRISLWYGVDPLAEDYPDWSSFAYTMNNPIRFIDPTGMGTEPADGDPIKTVQLEQVVVTAKRIPKSSTTKVDNTQVKLNLPLQNSQRQQQNNQATIDVPSQEKLNNAIAKNNADLIKTVVFDPDNASDPFEYLGIIPGVKIVGGVSKVIKTSGWVKKAVFKTLDPSIQKKISAAIKNGIVAPTGKQGIIKLTATEAAETGYQYKIKILGKGGDIRIYGNPLPNGHIIFDSIIKH
jgi:RHS repeat-associated protein